jgi:hypothetical protein
MLKDIWVVNPGRQMLVKVGRPFTPQVGVSDERTSAHLSVRGGSP